MEEKISRPSLQLRKIIKRLGTSSSGQVVRSALGIDDDLVRTEYRE